MFIIVLNVKNTLLNQISDIKLKHQTDVTGKINYSMCFMMLVYNYFLYLYFRFQCIGALQFKQTPKQKHEEFMTLFENASHPMHYMNFSKSSIVNREK